MPIGKKEALEQIDSALKAYENFKNNPKTEFSQVFERTHTEAVWRMMTTLERLAPPKSLYRVKSTNEHELAGVLKSLRADYEAGYIRTFREIIHGETFSDFLEMASHLLAEGYKDAAAVIAGGVLEQHVRVLAAKHEIPLTNPDSKGNPRPKKLNLLNQELKAKGAYGEGDEKQIVAWADIRNDAAHAHYDKYEMGQVVLMIQGIREFVLRIPA